MPEINAMPRARYIVKLLCAALACLLCSCDRQQPQSPPAATTQASTRPSLWRTLESASPVAVVSPGDELKLRAAIEQARSSAEQARQKWFYASADDRPRWAVKWAAPLVGKPADQTEHVCVAPVHWSPFRIEGVLASTPVKDLACGKHLGDLVSFPVEEISDWIHFTTQPASAAELSSPHEGGFTLQLLSEQYGTPK